MSTNKKKKLPADGGQFDQALRFVLNNFSDLQTIESESPLAQPYFLGEALKEAPSIDSPYPRAEILRREILAAAAEFWEGELPQNRSKLMTLVDEERRERGNKGRRYRYLLLEIKYFRQFFRPRSTPDAKNEQGIIDFLGVGRSPYFRHLKTARSELASILLKRIRPTFRLEQPPLPVKMIGRQQTVLRLKEALESDRSILISGQSGTGKTSLAADAIAKLTDRPIFWYTFRKGINIQVDALLFSIGTFLHQQRPSSLWLQLVADRGKIENLGVALGLLRGDISQLRSINPLFCFDNVEELSDELNPDYQSISKIRAILDTLLDGEGCQSVLMSQIPLFSVKNHIELGNFSPSETEMFLNAHGIDIAAPYKEELEGRFLGNPRLLHLLTTLHQPGQPFETTLSGLFNEGRAQAVFNRVWQQLDAGERILLQQLSVFAEPAPLDLFPASELSRLQGRHLFWQDGSGGISLLEFWREQLYNDRRKLPIEDRDRFHIAAAGALSTLGEVTRAFYHLVAAGEFGLGIQLWFPHRRSEIQRGFAGSASAIVAQISARHLSTEESNGLAVIKAELAQLEGNLAEGLTILESEKWHDEMAISIDATYIKAQFLDELGHSERALSDLSKAQTFLQQQTHRLIKLHTRSAYVYVLKDIDIEKAKKEMEIIQIESDYLAARIAILEGKFEEAKEILFQALALAEKTNYEPGISKLTFTLIEALSRLNMIDETIELIHQSAAGFQKTGNSLMAERIKTSLSSLYSHQGEIEKSIESDLASLEFFEASQMPYWIAAIGCNLSDSYLALGELDLAETYAQKALSTEEPHAIPYTLFNLGQVKLKRRDFDRAGHYFEEGLAMARQNGDRYIEAFLLRGKGETAMARNAVEAGIEKYREANRMFEEMGIQAEITKTRELMDKSPGLV